MQNGTIEGVYALTHCFTGTVRFSTFSNGVKNDVMRKMIMIAVLGAMGLTAQAQTQKQSVVVDDAPTIFPTSFNPYHSYADQGRAMYINNSHFYNSDNLHRSPLPVSNGQYFAPGNSNPVNQELYEAPALPSTTIYGGYVPIRQSQ